MCILRLMFIRGVRALVCVFVWYMPPSPPPYPPFSQQRERQTVTREELGGAAAGGRFHDWEVLRQSTSSGTSARWQWRWHLNWWVSPVAVRCANGGYGWPQQQRFSKRSNTPDLVSGCLAARHCRQQQREQHGRTAAMAGTRGTPVHAGKLSPS
jgi:hypothetical protein